MIAPALAPRLVRRGLEVFAAISLIGFVALLFYGNNLDRFLRAIVGVDFRWLAVGVALASLDWFGGGLRLYILCRHLYPAQSLRGAILAGGLNTWASYLTPSQTGGGPMMVYTLSRYGTPLPEAMVAGLMSFVATVIFFAIAGPLAIVFGAGRSLEQHGIIGQTVDLYDLFRLSLGGFVGIGLFIVLLMSFPSIARVLVRWLSGWLRRRGRAAMADRVAKWDEGIDRAHQAIVAFRGLRGIGTFGAAVILSAAAHANKLLAGYVVLQALGIPAPFLEVLLLQTLISFLLYFAPTPGGSGLAEILSAAVMSIYVPRDLMPSYILFWRVPISYLTVGFGSTVFWRWLKVAEARGEEVATP